MNVFADRHAEFKQARQLLGPGKVIGVTASSTEEAIKACRAGADYLGVGTVYSTATYVFYAASLLCPIAYTAALL